MGSGDDGYEQISSDEEDLESGAFKLPSFDVDYTAEDLASVPSVQYDPYERELRPLQHFTPPQTTAYEAQLSCLKNQDLDDPTSVWAESAAKLAEMLETGTVCVCVITLFMWLVLHIEVVCHIRIYV